MHGNIVLQSDAREYSSLFTELGAAYYDKGLYAVALRVYEELASYDEVRTNLPHSKLGRHSINDTRLLFRLPMSVF